MFKQEICEACGKKLRIRENDSRILFLCINTRCENYWMKKGCEILMVLK